MKTTIIKLLFFFSIIALGSCESNLRMPDCTKTAFPLLTLDASSDKKISSGVLNAKFTVDMYYKDYPQSARLVVARNGDYSNVKVLKSDVSTFPSVQTLTADQLKQLFGLVDITTGDYFEVGLDVQMEDGNWYPAFNPKGVAYGSGSMNLVGASPILTFKAVCTLVMDDFVGTANIDDANFYGGAYTASLEKVDATHLKIKNFATCAGDVILTINPDTYGVTVAQQVFDANLAALGAASYTNPFVKGTGEIDPCKRKITLNTTCGVDQGSFGPCPMVITMN